METICVSSLYRCCLKKYFSNIREIPTYTNLIRYCSIFTDLNRKYELGNFEQDLKPYLKTRKKRNSSCNSSFTRPLDSNPIIICKDRKLNHYFNQVYDKFKPIPLASQNWNSYKSHNDSFTINIYAQKELRNENDNKSFEHANLNPLILDVLKEHKIETMSEVQEKTIPIILSGKNSMISAETGCGKTLAYLLPILEQVLIWKESATEQEYNAPYVVIFTPSRELTIQILEVIKWFKKINITCQSALGGHMAQKLINPTIGEVDILVSTIGIINKLIHFGLYNIKSVRHVVLDEADALLDDSFNSLTTSVLKHFPLRSAPLKTHEKGVQLTLVSATTPTSIDELLGGLIEVDQIEKIFTKNLHRVMPHVPQKFIRMTRSTKPSYLLQIVKKEYQKKAPVIIFCNKSETCDWLSIFLEENNVKNLKLTGELVLKERRGIFKQFQEGDVNILVTTSIAARGLDTTKVQHVVNYDFPSFISDYIHRCGRTGRLGSKVNGKVTNLISGKNEIELVQKIEKCARTGTEFENVNPNIPRIIAFRNSSEAEQELEALKN